MNDFNRLLPTTILSGDKVAQLRAAGYAVVPLEPTDEMLKAGAPSCFIVPDGAWETAMEDAATCYQSMIELGCL